MTEKSFKAVSVKPAWIAAAATVGFFALFYIFTSSAKFGFACGFGLYCAVLYYYKKPLRIFFAFAAAAATIEQSVYMVYSAALPALLIFTVVAAFKKTGKSFSPLKLCIAAIICRAAIFFNGGGAAEISSYIVDISISAIFLLISVNALKAPLWRGLKHLTIDETVCVAAVLLSFYAGLYGLRIYDIKIYLIIAAFSILVSLFICPLSFSLSYCLVIGMAVCMLSGNPAYLGVFAVYALAANIFKDTSKYLAAVSIILIDLLFAYYFNIFDSYSYYDILSLSAGCAAFLILPKRFIKKAAAELGGSSEKQLSRHIINRTRAELYSKLVKVSEVFFEMEKIFCGMIKGYMSPENAVDMLSADAAEEVCENCPEKTKCRKNNAEAADSGIKSAIKAGIDKGKVTLLDIPPQLASICIRTNSLLASCNRLSNSYRQYAVVISNLDTSRALIGRQFKGVGDILSQLAKETKNSLGFDASTEKAICDELAYNNIVCAEAAVYNENNCCKNISLLVKTADSNNKNLSKIISRLGGLKMVIHKREESRTPGYSVVHLKPAPKFDVIFGAAGCAKEGKSISGDTHTLTRISDDRFLLALCDGMGSGESAEKTSSTAISMVENFYRAGFDSDTILAAVNRLLNVGGEDNFAALDICAIDLSKGVCDFIKLGSPEGYLKTKDNTQVIESNALPVGILEELTPSITTKTVKSGDMIVLVSDGVCEAFSDSDKLKEFIFTEDTINPQQLAENILYRALYLSGNTAKDDMTVLTMRLYIQI